ncbi:VOC family protein [Labedella populi]|uniref:VOC family protein n=1 Tax=Labedella populi TaxID=2498850 RepID=A0A3S3ZWY1_9MICO|nr:VOC family protein [Labedella populi]RWZ68460.1 VOC family protein [Labedella populi]
MISLQYCAITVEEIDSSIAFYRDALGYEVRNDVSSGEFRWVTLGSGSEPTAAELVLSQPHAGQSPEDGDTLQELLVKGVLGFFVFRTDDVDAAFERARAARADVLQEPIDQPWGPRDWAVRDPSGNIIRVAQA